MHADVAGIEWTINAYSLMLAVFIMREVFPDTLEQRCWFHKVRAVICNAIGYAAEREIPDYCAIDRIQGKAPPWPRKVDRRAVATTDPGRGDT